METFWYLFPDVKPLQTRTLVLIIQVGQSHEASLAKMPLAFV